MTALTIIATAAAYRALLYITKNAPAGSLRAKVAAGIGGGGGPDPTGPK